MDNENSYHEWLIISKILKSDKNNQYDFAMTKPMLTGCIKEQPAPSWLTFNLLLETVDSDNKIVHLFVVNIKFDEETSTGPEYIYNEILTPIIEEQKNLEVNERRSIYQLLELFDKTNDDKLKSYRCIRKFHTTLFLKNYYALFERSKISNHEIFLESYKNLFTLYIPTSTF